MSDFLSRQDPEVSELIAREEKRQREQLELIPSENYISPAVREAVGSVLMNKYSEGYPGKKYYQGNTHLDALEGLCQTRALTLFHLSDAAWSVNVQAVTGSVANLAVLSALLQPGDTLLSLRLTDGGHLSHGWQLSPTEKVSFTSRVFRPVFYEVHPDTGLLDYDVVAALATRERPKVLISGGTGYARQIDHAAMGRIADSVGAFYLADVAHEAGLIAAGVNAAPFPDADVVTMTTRKTLRGPIGAIILSRKELAGRVDRAVFPGLQGGPQNHSIAGIAVALQEAATPAFAAYARQVVKNAQTLAAELQQRNFRVVSGGTDKHLLVVDVRNRGLRGYQFAIVLEAANIIVNKNTVPQETHTPWNPSGIRLGTPAVTTRGMKERDMTAIAEWIDRVAKIVEREMAGYDIVKTRAAASAHAEIQRIGADVRTFAAGFPVPSLAENPVETASPAAPFSQVPITPGA